MDGSSDPILFGGTVVDFWNRDGRFNGVLVSDDGRYDGYVSSGHDEGNPQLVDGTFHAAYGAPVPEPTTLLLCVGVLGFAARRRRKRRKASS